MNKKDTPQNKKVVKTEPELKKNQSLKKTKLKKYK